MSGYRDEYAERVRELVAHFEWRLPADRVECMFELCDAREPGVAMEILCDNIADFDIAVSTEDLNRIASVGTDLQIKSSYWSKLPRQIEK